MLAFRASETPSHIMHAVALSLTDEELASVAHYLATHGKERAAMKTWTRREFGGLAGASLLAALGPRRREAKPSRASW